MPNTLCHIGIQGPVNGIFLSKKDLLWVVIACVIPDIPWIVLKILLATELFNPYDLRLYCTAQASLLFCLVLGGGLCLLAQHCLKIFFILGANSLFHLILDALQIKWGNGVHIVSPMSWDMFHLDFFWPEYRGTFFLSAAGLIYLIYNWNSMKDSKPLHMGSRWKYLVCSLFFAVYCLGPLYFIEQLDAADTYYVKTMRNTEERTGKTIKLDRAHYFAATGEVKIYSGERLKLTGKRPSESGRVSFSGIFKDKTTISSHAYHLHTDYRDAASYIGLFMACTLILHSLLISKINSNKTHSG